MAYKMEHLIWLRYFHRCSLGEDGSRQARVANLDHFAHCDSRRCRLALRLLCGDSGQLASKLLTANEINALPTNRKQGKTVDSVALNLCPFARNRHAKPHRVWQNGLFKLDSWSPFNRERGEQLILH